MRLLLPLELTRAALELLRARLTLARVRPGELMETVGLDPEERTPIGPLPSDIARVSWLIPRVAARLPWRADCLVQALAARRWLASLGHMAELHLGTRKQGERFEAHAWLTHRGAVVTGGRVDGYARLTRPPESSSEP